MTRARRRILLGVTSDVSLSLMVGLPERLVAEGWEVHVVASSGERLRELGDVPGLTTHAVHMERDPRPTADLRSLIAWWRLIRLIRPYVLFVGTPKAGLLGMVAGLVGRVPVRIYHLRGLRLETAKGASWHVYRAIETLALGAATSVVAVSHSLMNRAVELHLAPRRKFVVLGQGSSNGVDTDRFSPQADAAARESLREELKLAPDTPVVGFVGRLHPDKGLAFLCGASHILTRRGVRHQLLVVGGADHASAAELRTMLSRLDAQVTLVGAVPSAAPYYRMMDVHCLPTLREGFPNAVLEASASGVVSVTTDATGAVDSVLAEDTGIIVPVGDGAALADALQELLSDSEKRRRMARRAYEHTVRNFSRPHVQSAIVNYLRSSIR